MNDCKKCKHLVPTAVDRMNTNDKNIHPVYTCEKWECVFEEETNKEVTE